MCKFVQGESDRVEIMSYWLKILASVDDRCAFAVIASCHLNRMMIHDDYDITTTANDDEIVIQPEN